ADVTEFVCQRGPESVGPPLILGEPLVHTDTNRAVIEELRHTLHIRPEAREVHIRIQVRDTPLDHDLEVLGGDGEGGRPPSRLTKTSDLVVRCGVDLLGVEVRPLREPARRVLDPPHRGQPCSSLRRNAWNAAWTVSGAAPTPRNSAGICPATNSRYSSE